MGITDWCERVAARKYFVEDVLRRTRSNVEVVDALLGYGRALRQVGSDHTASGMARERQQLHAASEELGLAMAEATLEALRAINTVDEIVTVEEARKAILERLSGGDCDAGRD